MDADETPLTMHEKGVSGKPTAYDRLMSSPQWKAAKALKNPDTEVEFTRAERKDGAAFIAQALWTKTNTEELGKRLEGKEPVFITMPSTTGHNLIPEALAELLQSEIGGTVISGSEVTTATHTNEMKAIPIEQRPFVPREYVLNDPTILREKTAGKAVVIVEDVFSSGASAKGFCDSLKEERIQIHTVAGLLGDNRLAAEPQLVTKLQKTLKHAGIETVKAKDISAVLSRGQIATLIDVVNNTRRKDEQERIAQNLQGILDSRAARHLGQSVWRSKGEFARTAREDIRNENTGERISTDARVTSGGGNDHVRIQNADSNIITEGGGKKTANEAAHETHSMTATQTRETTNERNTTMTATPNESGEDRITRLKKEFTQTLIDNMTKNLDGNLGLLPNQQLPFNGANGVNYTGANMIALAAQNRPQNIWLTRSQIIAAGGSVLKGEHGATIQFWKTHDKAEDGTLTRLDQPKLDFAKVFNVAQTTLTDFNAKQPNRTTPEELTAAFKIEHNQAPNAKPAYDKATDTISVPPPNRFPTPNDYHRAVIGQIAARQDAKYSKEEPPTPGTPEAAAKEMKLAIAAAILGDACGVGHTADLNNTPYNNHWKRMVNNHPQDAMRTASQANTVAKAVIEEARSVLHEMKDKGIEIPSPENKPPQPLAERMNLNVPYEQREQAKEAGCRWDKDNKTWYAPAGTDLNKIAQWPEKRDIQVTSPRDDLTNTMTKIGFVVSGNHPLMDGNPHRIEVVGDSGHKQSGYYRIYSDGVPAGYMKNHLTGEDTKWKAKGYELTPEMKTTLQKSAIEKYDLREQETTKRQEQVSNRLETALGKMTAITEPTQYMKNKGIGVEPGVYQSTDKAGQTKMHVPLTDINGKIWSMTNIDEDGKKTYTKDGKKHGAFHVVGGLDALKVAPAVIMAEGYATAVSLKNGLNTPVVAAMDAGNLLPVAQEMRKAFPQKAIVICGDDDRKQLDNPQVGKNVGKEKAMDAALAVGGQAVFPIFPQGTDKQLSDFNDLATKTELGVEGLKQQTKPAIQRAMNNQEANNSKTLINEAVKQKEQARENLADKAKELQRDKEKAQDARQPKRGGLSR